MTQIFITAFVVLLVVLTWLFRYDIEAVGTIRGASAAYVLDRWTGKTHLLIADKKLEMTSIDLPKGATPLPSGFKLDNPFAGLIPPKKD